MRAPCRLCGKPSVGQLLCNMHYARWLRTGTPHRTPVSVMDRFMAKVDKQADCWIWLAATDGRGYGKFSINGVLVGAHRASYLLHGGIIPPGFDLDHLCRVTLCVRPTHLEPVTPEENRRREAAATSNCPNGHLYTPENTSVLPDGRRRCRACKKANFRRYSERVSTSSKEL